MCVCAHVRVCVPLHSFCGMSCGRVVRTAPAEKTKDEYDVTLLAEVKCIPTGFTKWDRTTVDTGDLSLGEFLKAFKEVTGKY